MTWVYNGTTKATLDLALWQSKMRVPRPTVIHPKKTHPPIHPIQQCALSHPKNKLDLDVWIEIIKLCRRRLPDICQANPYLWEHFFSFSYKTLIQLSAGAYYPKLEKNPPPLLDWKNSLIRHEFFSSYPMYHLENFPTQIFNLKTADTLHLNFEEIFCEKVISSLSKQAKGKK